ncbi:kinetochore protein spc24-like [Apostichopus japonicus]|uniref:kinetochore protein spc24-like n=1 Tax=Stichopus japonicus TaxID=307972 RepID=UPI003AB6593D
MSSSIGTVLDNIEQGNAEDAVTNIINMLTNPEEVEKIREFGDTMRSVQAEQQKQQSQVQDIIKGLLTLKDEEGAAAEALKSSTTHEEQNKEAERLLSDACQEVEKVQNGVQDSQRQLYELEEKESRLVEQREIVKEETTQILPKTRYNISLYTCITGIKWDYECPPEQIKGYISTTTDVRPFSLNSQQNSKYFITNYLWDLVGSAYQTK